jgi:hypothetical protein
MENGTLERVLNALRPATMHWGFAMVDGRFRRLVVLGKNLQRT